MARVFRYSLIRAIALTAGLLVIIFIVTNWNNDYGDIEFPTVKCNCPTAAPPALVKTERVTKAKEVPLAPVTTTTTETTTTTTTTPPLPPCHPISNESAVQRAIIIYYPHHQSEYFFPEIRW